MSIFKEIGGKLCISFSHLGEKHFQVICICKELIFQKPTVNQSNIPKRKNL